MYESKKIMWEVSVVGDEENNWNKILNHHINRYFPTISEKIN